MGLGAEIRPDNQRFLQPVQELVGWLRYRIQTALGQVQPESVDGGKPDIGQQQVDQQQADTRTPEIVPR